MNLQSHISTLKDLLAGRHPETGNDLVGNALDDPTVLRRLMRALQALEQLQLEHGIKGSLRRKRAPWSTPEDEKLQNEFKSSGTECFGRLALEYERTPRSVAERAVVLGLIKSRSQCVTKEDRAQSLFAPKAGEGES